VTRPVRWSRAALNDLKDQLAYIARYNPAAARDVTARIRHSAKALEELATGRPGRVGGTYEKPVTRLPYIIAYEIKALDARETVVILRVIHAARDWPADAWPE